MSMINLAKYRNKVAKSKELTIYELYVKKSKTLIIVDMQDEFLGYLGPRSYISQRRQLILHVSSLAQATLGNGGRLVSVSWGSSNLVSELSWMNRHPGIQRVKKPSIGLCKERYQNSSNDKESLGMARSLNGEIEIVGVCALNCVLSVYSDVRNILHSNPDIYVSREGIMNVCHWLDDEEFLRQNQREVINEVYKRYGLPVPR